MSHDRGCFRCFEDSRSDCGRSDCPYKTKGVQVVVRNPQLLQKALRDAGPKIERAIREAISGIVSQPVKPQLSKRAAALWANVQKSTQYYPWTPRPSRYMQELIDAGLVTEMGRVVKMARYFVPRHSRPLQVEKFPGEK